MPLDGQRLIIEPSFPNAALLSDIGQPKADPDDDDDGWRMRNRWYSHNKRCDIIIMEKAGKVTFGLVPGIHHLNQDLQTLGCMEAWGLEQEHRALNLLGTMLRHHNFKQYILTGMFLETSERSGVTYMFRRLKPTVAIKPGPDGRMRILTSLCMHPIAYYAGSWGGAMCPTDDVIAHLALMRGDERLFWARSNQHPPYRPEAGL